MTHLPYDHDLAKSLRMGQNVRPRCCSTDHARREHYARCRTIRLGLRLLGEIHRELVVKTT